MWRTVVLVALLGGCAGNAAAPDGSGGGGGTGGSGGVGGSGGTGGTGGMPDGDACAAVTQCGPQDGCCAPGCSAATDPDCSPSCGNGIVEPGEQCDKGIPAGESGACPTGCDDQDPCTTETMQGSAENCTARCVRRQVTDCGRDDGCCPSGCNATTDPNCTPMCGNGVIEAGETCDPPSSCPTSCNDGNVCTADSVVGSAATCNVTCRHTPITACGASDGCCPAGCNANNDADCAPRCGNSVVEAGETCDPPGSCPTLASCNDNNACTTDLLVGNANTCTAQCAHGAVSQCSFSSDGCCPSACNFNTDIDCDEVCGNGVLEGSEQCDTGIPAGMTGACPTSCSGGGLTCQASQLVGTGCQAHCTTAAPVTTCGSSADQCCPFGCNMSSDADCFGTWAPTTVASGVAFNTTCTNLPINLIASHHYVVTTCVATGTALASNGDTVVEVHDPSGALLVQDDDCLTTPNLIASAGWSCTNGNGSRFASCAGETPGGFNAPVSGTYQICVRSFSSTSTGTATVTLWSN